MMTPQDKLDGLLYAKMICNGMENLRINEQEVNDLNVFPIPDGDTGANMLMTMQGGADIALDCDASLNHCSQAVANAMLMSARGNSGVILSQFFDGLARGFRNLDEADAQQTAQAFRMGVEHAYKAVMQPTEGTILTVAKDATEYACRQNVQTPQEFVEEFLDEARRSLERTPDLLPVLKESGVVDSGGAGLIYIMEGMIRALNGEEIVSGLHARNQTAETVNYDLFTSDSELEFGYCTEVLVRLQNRKTDIAHFDTAMVTGQLEALGDSVVCVKNDSVLKIHVHTMEPGKVMALCQEFGEFLKVKVENMSLQHNNIIGKDDSSDETAEEKEPPVRLATVVVASGRGIQQMFEELGADYIVDGGQSMNPSSEDFIHAFECCNAENIIVLPNNSNVILAAQQAAKLYHESNVVVIESKTIGQGHAALSMMNPDLDEIDEIVAEMEDAMSYAITACISECVRDLDTTQIHTKSGDYIGFSGKEILSDAPDRVTAACRMIDSMDLSEHAVCILLEGLRAESAETQLISDYIQSHVPGMEVYIMIGEQEIYDYIFVME